MRRASLLALMIVLLLTAGCTSGGGSEGGEQGALDFRARVIAADFLTLTAELRADYGDRVYDFKLKYEGDAKTGTRSVLEPENIAGVKVEIGESITLSYEGSMLDTGVLPGGKLSPVEAFPLMIEAWQSGFISDTYSEKLDGRDVLVLKIVVGTMQHLLKIDGETLLPVCGELSKDGVTVISCAFSEVTLG